MYESRGKLFVAGLMLFLTFFLPGCKKSNTLQNGVAKTQLSGAAASTQAFKFTLPANVQTLMIQSGAHDQVELHLLDADKNPLAICPTATFCRTDFAAAGVYYVQLNGLGQFSNLSLVASWSGPDTATLKNAVPVTGLSGKTGTVILQSLHVPFYIGELNLQTTASGSYTLELLDSAGSVLKACTDTLQCTHAQTFNGNYFVRVTGVSDFTDLNILASWGGAGEATIQNGVPKIISGAANSEHFESLYVEPGTQALMLQKRRFDAPVFMEILDTNGQAVEYCEPSCVLNNPAPGLYYVRSVFGAAVNNFAFTAVWGGENGGQLKNGVSLTGLSGSEEDMLLKSVYVPENTHALMLQTGYDADVYLELLDSTGDQVWSGSGQSGSAIPDLPAGLYFVRIILPEDTTDFTLTAAWGSNGTGTLQNGVPLTGLSGNEHDALLQSVYIPENTHALMLQTGYDARVHLELIHAQYGEVWSGPGNSNSTMHNPPAGLYFVRIFLEEDQTDFALTAAWGSNGNGTLQNGVPLTGLSGNEMDALLQSVYISENTHALMLQTGYDARVHLELIHAQYGEVWSGPGNSNSTMHNPPAGLYFVRIFLEEDQTDFALTAAWGSNGAGTLQNSVPLTGLSGNEMDALLQSVYIPESTHALMLQTGYDARVHLELIHAQYGEVWSGPGNSNSTMHNPPAGLYFVRIFLEEDHSDFTLTAAWGSNGIGTLQNGIPLSGLSGNEQDVLLQSVYIPENTQSLTLQTSIDANVDLELVDFFGYRIWNGPGHNNSTIPTPPEGLYFIRIFLPQDTADFSLTATWSDQPPNAE